MNTKKHIVLAFTLPLLLTFNAFSQSHWHIQPIPLQTRWAKDVSPINSLKAYPRPQMTRRNWDNLDGLWDYAITKKDASQPQSYIGQILVPFPIESALSGVKKVLQPDENLWYRRTFEHELKTGDRLLLHFGAVDWQTTIYINGKEAGVHMGGYTEFTLDITDELKPHQNELVVKVFDPSDQGIGPHGKQVLNPHDIYYTATSGIWQTVWLEEVPNDHIEGLTLTPNIDSGYLAVTVRTTINECVKLTAGNQTIGGMTNELIKLPVTNAHSWSPEDPYLYDLLVKTETDEVKSYFGMRKISIGKDEKDIDRIFLNNKPYYNLGVLDQGYWPDGLYTAPTDEALSFDIKAIKAMGFNTIRKHIKVEPARWYYWADKLGMLVWQDMVNPNQDLPEGAKEAFEQQCKETLEQLHNSPCITTWVLFNEKWGQYDQKRLTDWIKRTDPSRIVNGHTGEILYVNDQLRSPSPNAYVDADLTDVHSYPFPMMPIKQTGKAQVVGEFGGIGVSIFGHEWEPVKGWGYVEVTPAQLEGKYHLMIDNLKELEEHGLSGSIYTQPFDVEGEENGLMTYDREIVKMPFAEIRKINSLLVATTGTTTEVTAQNADKNDETETYAKGLEAYLKGDRNLDLLKTLSALSIRLNDKFSSKMLAESYIETLKGPLSYQEIELVGQYTKSTNDPGFAIIIKNKEQFGQVLGELQVNSLLVNIICTGVITPELDKGDPDWGQIQNRLKPYGNLGKEAYLKSRANDDLFKQDWKDFVPTAKLYLNQFGFNISNTEKQMLKNQLSQHQ